MDQNTVLFGLIPCTGSVIFFFVIFGTAVLLRWFKHREIVAMAEKGLLPEQYARAPRSQGRGFLVWGLVLAGLGLALVLGLLPVAITSAYNSPLLLLGLIPLFIGLGLLIVYLVTRKEDKAKETKASAETGVAGD